MAIFNISQNVAIGIQLETSFRAIKGKHIVVEVIAKVFSVTKLRKIIKKTFAKISIIDSGYFI